MIANAWKRIRRVVTLPVFITFLITALVFGVIGWWIPSPLQASRYTGAVLLQSSNFNNYQYIDPLLACEIGTEEAFTNLTPLKNALSSSAEQAVRDGYATHVSIYFRSLKDAHWFDINPEFTYAPASLLKTFVMMAYYKESRDLNDPNLLNRQIIFKGSPNPGSDDPGAVIPHFVNGQLYTINDVIKQMIVYSDNDALSTLTDNFDPQTTQSLSEIFSDLKISSPLTDEKSYLMSVNQYAMVFRVLYSSTYLSRNLSERALSILTQAQFNNGLAAGVSTKTPVAHKFGVTTLPATATAPATPELHDCGIIYYPNNPYVLCVMTRGSNFPSLEAIIKDISTKTYAGVQMAYPN